MRNMYRTVIKPVVTEKSSAAYGARKEYAFEVHPEASKPEIREAIEGLFGVRVSKVRTLQQRSKLRTMGRTRGTSARWKKAYVTLHGDDEIEIFEG